MRLEIVPQFVRVLPLEIGKRTDDLMDSLLDELHLYASNTNLSRLTMTNYTTGHT